MLPISSDSFPSTSDELAAALTRGFGEHGIVCQSVRAEGAEFPKIDSLSIDLTGARVARDLRLPCFERGAREAVLTIGKFDLRAEPMFFEKTPLSLEINGRNAGLNFAGIPERGALVLNNAESGGISVTIATEDLEGLINQVAAEAAKKQGIEVKKTRLELTSSGPRAVSFRAEVTAKMFIMTASLTVSGQIDLDAELNARFSKLTLGGDGMITKVAGGFIQPRLTELESRVIPLLPFPMGGIRLRDIEVSTGKTLFIRAAFGES